MSERFTEAAPEILEFALDAVRTMIRSLPGERGMEAAAARVSAEVAKRIEAGRVDFILAGENGCGDRPTNRGSLSVSWQAGGHTLGLIEAREPGRPDGFDGYDEWLLRLAGEFLGDAVLRWSAPGTAVERLTVRETIVARLVASGLTNAQIASRLGVSRTTVSTHVAHVLAKLGFRSCAQVAAWVARREAATGSVGIASLL